MRTARTVGLSQDGQSLIVVTDSGEELAVLADGRLRAALRGDGPRLGQLEIEMDSALRPRDIQSRIRAGDSVENVARVAGVPVERVERFAAPVLAEREHVASLAMSASVRRRGETSGHRNLRVALTERLMGRGVDIDSVEWDSARMEDGRWAVKATYRSGEAHREAVFHFDVSGRFSVAGNDEARWVLGEHSTAKGPQPGRKRSVGVDSDEGDNEPTLDLSDELALVRAIQGRSDAADAENNELAAAAERRAYEELHAVEDLPADDEQDTHVQTQDQPDELAVASELGIEPEGQAQEAATAAAKTGEELLPPDSELGALYEMLGGDGSTGDSARVYSGLTDASAVPVTGNGGWEPAIVVNYPVEPSEEDDSNDPYREVAKDRAEEEQELEDETFERSHPVEREPAQAAEQVPEDAEPSLGSHPATDELVADDSVIEAPSVSTQEPLIDARLPAEPASEDEQEQPKAAKKPAKRKRASVPSWDEIMFGGPPRSGTK